jgi:hypothetical protein
MGMFNDNVSPNRHDWTYTYFGSQLLPYATKLHAEYFSKEKHARGLMADLMKDMSVSQNDTKVQEAKRDIANFGTLKEQCSVFQHEFDRNPDKTYELGLGDVTFFGLVGSGK